MNDPRVPRKPSRPGKSLWARRKLMPKDHAGEDDRRGKGFAEAAFVMVRRKPVSRNECAADGAFAAGL
jgi:hypothetical protein